MTPQEAREILAIYRFNLIQSMSNQLEGDIEALDMAIKALEQQPSEDCISRSELLSRIDAERKHLLDIKMDGAEHIVVHHARRIIEDMPSVTPTLEQINCLTGRPCEVCKFHSDNGCSKWKCIFEEGTK